MGVICARDACRCIQITLYKLRMCELALVSQMCNKDVLCFAERAVPSKHSAKLNVVRGSVPGCRYDVFKLL